MSEADELAIAKARAAAATSRAQAEAVVGADEAMLRSFPAKAREVLTILERAGYDGDELHALGDRYAAIATAREQAAP